MWETFIRFFKEERTARFISIGLLGLTGIYLFSLGPHIYADAPSYIEMDPRRSAGYPFFLFMLRIFGGAYLHIAIAIQIILSITAVIFFFDFIRDTLRIRYHYVLLLLPPLIFFLIREPFPREIMTEGLAFSLFLFVMIWFFRAVLKKSFLPLTYSAALLTVLLLVRSQFLVLIPLFLIGMAHIFFYNRDVKTMFTALLFILAVYPASQLIDRTYHLAFHGHFITSPFGANGIAANAFYVAKEHDEHLFEQEETRKVFRQIYEQSYADTLNLEAYRTIVNPESGAFTLEAVNHYFMNFNEILHRTTTPILSDRYSEKDGIMRWVAIEENLSQFIVPLVRANFIDFVVYQMIYDPIARGFGSRFLLLAFAAFFLFAAIRVPTGNPFATLFFYTGMAHILSLILIAIGGRVLPRYLIYTEFLFYTIIAGALICTFVHLHHNQSSD